MDSPIKPKSFITRLSSFLLARYAPRGARPSFSQAGEDIVVSTALKRLGVTRPTYIDIGSHHPVFGNTTYLFYLRGGHGVLVEPNIEMCELSKQKRPRDICLNSGAGRAEGEADFYLFERSTRSTFSRSQASEWEAASGQKPVVTKRTLVSLDMLVDAYFKDVPPDLISIDAEGYDLEILKGYSWKMRPKVFCIEMSEGVKEYMAEKGYDLDAYVFENAIFVDTMAKLS